MSTATSSAVDKGGYVEMNYFPPAPGTKRVQKNYRISFFYNTTNLIAVRGYPVFDITVYYK